MLNLLKTGATKGRDGQRLNWARTGRPHRFTGQGLTTQWLGPNRPPRMATIPEDAARRLRTESQRKQPAAGPRKVLPGIMVPLLAVAGH